MKEKFLISGLVVAVVTAGTIVVMAWDDPIPVHAHDSETLISVLQMMQQKSGPTREQCFDNQLTLAGLLTDWQPLQPPSPTTMELNQWVIATVLNTQLYALCGQWESPAKMFHDDFTITIPEAIPVYSYPPEPGTLIITTDLAFLDNDGR